MTREPAHRPEAGRPVSFDDDLLILVDSEDNAIGTLDKARCHDGEGILHRAFSLFIFNPEGHLLLQQRARDKRLWPLYWSNSCCSHPRAGESMGAAVGRRLYEELGLRAALRFVYKFEYTARYADLGSEHELCSVYVGHTGQEPTPHPLEIEAWRWVEPAQLDTEMAASTDRFTPWFRLEWTTLRTAHAHLLPDAQST